MPLLQLQYRDRLQGDRCDLFSAELVFSSGLNVAGVEGREGHLFLGELLQYCHPDLSLDRTEKKKVS